MPRVLLSCLTCIIHNRKKIVAIERNKIRRVSRRHEAQRLPLFVHFTVIDGKKYQLKE